jgi:hypothetical protein
MKNKIIITFTLCLSLLCFEGKANALAPLADTTLSFSKVILYDLGATSPSNAQTFTVPSGKVWKIESVSMGSSGSAPTVFLRNSSTQNIAFFASSASTASASFPFWLPADFSGSFLNNSSSYRCSISITEYTKTPAP